MENYYQNQIDYYLRRALIDMLECELMPINHEWLITMVWLNDYKQIRVTASVNGDFPALQQLIVLVDQPIDAAFIEQSVKDVTAWFVAICDARNEFIRNAFASGLVIMKD